MLNPDDAVPFFEFASDALAASYDEANVIYSAVIGHMIARRCGSPSSRSPATAGYRQRVGLKMRGRPLFGRCRLICCRAERGCRLWGIARGRAIGILADGDARGEVNRAPGGCYRLLIP